MPIVSRTGEQSSRSDTDKLVLQVVFHGPASLRARPLTAQNCRQWLPTFDRDERLFSDQVFQSVNGLVVLIGPWRVPVNRLSKESDESEHVSNRWKSSARCVFPSRLWREVIHCRRVSGLRERRSRPLTRRSLAHGAKRLTIAWPVWSRWRAGRNRTCEKAFR